MTPRPFCWVCRRPCTDCYCRWLAPFAPRVRILILMHPMEARRPIATGRMTHLSLTNSLLRVGIDFTHDSVVNDFIQAQPTYLLFPAAQSISADAVSMEREIGVIIPDGTWRTVNRMMRESENLHGLDRIRIDPTQPSDFRVRKQPREGCLATIEATAELLRALGDARCERLTDVFCRFVDQQQFYITGSYAP